MVERILIIVAALSVIYFARSRLGDLTYDRIVGTFFLISFSLVGLILLYGYLMGR